MKKEAFLEDTLVLTSLTFTCNVCSNPCDQPETLLLEQGKTTTTHRLPGRTSLPPDQCRG